MPHFGEMPLTLTGAQKAGLKMMAARRPRMLLFLLFGVLLILMIGAALQPVRTFAQGPVVDAALQEVGEYLSQTVSVSACVFWGSFVILVTAAGAYCRRKVSLKWLATRWYSWVVAGLVVGAILLIIYGGDPVCQANCKRIRQGMTELEVEAILGRQCDQMLHAEGFYFKNCWWSGESGDIWVTFGARGSKPPPGRGNAAKYGKSLTYRVDAAGFDKHNQPFLRTKLHKLLKAFKVK